MVVSTAELSAEFLQIGGADVFGEGRGGQRGGDDNAKQGKPIHWSVLRSSVGSRDRSPRVLAEMPKKVANPFTGLTIK